MHLRPEEITLAELLKTAGYGTAHFGKWHLTAEGMGQPLPIDQGYEYAFFTYNNANPSHRDPVNFFRNREQVGPLQGYSCHLVLDEALKWLEKNEGIEKPFYINIWFNEPHNKVAAPEELAGRHTYNKEYYGCIENMDQAVGRLLRYLEEKGLENQTMIIFASDNGSPKVGSNDPLRGEKTFNYEGGIRVPFILRWPDKAPSGVTSEITGSFTDLLPSIAALTGIPVPDDRVVDGMDISPVFLHPDKEFKRDKPLFFFRYFHDPVCMLRDGDWVLLGYRDQPPPHVRDYDQPALAKLKPERGEESWTMWNFQPAHMQYLKSATPRYFELYDISEDISQEWDLSSRYPDLAEQMKTQMLTLRLEMIEEGGDWYAKN
jgi:arylsulfatase A